MSSFHTRRPRTGHWEGAGSGNGWARRPLVVLALATSVTLTLWLASAEAAAADWSVQPAPTPVGAQEPGLFSVSCWSKSACTAVGSFVNRAGTRTLLAQRWNGTVWAIQPNPKPASARSALFRSVSCPSPTLCVAVGYFDTKAGATVPLAERWNGTSWALQSVPRPTKFSQLEGVSCTSATACIAVGFSTSGRTSTALVERWNGTRWTIQRTPNARDKSLYGVSCPSKTACFAAGVSSGCNRSVPLAERWNGSSWTILPAACPSATHSSSLVSVSCTSRAACVAVGGISVGEGGQLPLAERWNGTNWTIQRIPRAPGGLPTYLSSVSCAAKTDCTAVGYYFPSRGSRTLAERWDGTNWAIQRTPTLPGVRTGQLQGVSCVAKLTCIAVGSALSRSNAGSVLVERYSQ